MTLTDSIAEWKRDWGNHSRVLRGPLAELCNDLLSELERLEVRVVKMEEVAKAAKTWWHSHRPEVFSHAKHLRNPTINMTGTPERDHPLALAVAALEDVHE